MNWEEFKAGWEELRVVGQGGFGKVSLWRSRSSPGELRAVKAVDKATARARDSLGYCELESEVLRELDHPFIVGCSGVMDSEDHLRTVLEYLPGGDLFEHMDAVGRLDEDHARFYAAEVALALEYIHGQNLVYRDLKTENLVLDGAGHVKVTDFGMSKRLSPLERTMTFCGSVEYCSPEMLRRRGHGQATDWWGFGILLYEMMLGEPPFYEDDDEDQTKDLILHGEGVKFPDELGVEGPSLSDSAKSLIRSLLDRDEDERRGFVAGHGVTRHPFFTDHLDMAAVLERRVPVPSPVLPADPKTS